MRRIHDRLTFEPGPEFVPIPYPPIPDDLRDIPVLTLTELRRTLGAARVHRVSWRGGDGCFKRVDEDNSDSIVDEIKVLYALRDSPRATVYYMWIFRAYSPI